MLGCPIAEVAQKLQPLYEKLYCWKYGIRGGEGIWDIALCDPLYRMHEIYAGSLRKEIKDIFHGVVYLISPLKLGKYEAEQAWYFYERGLQTSIQSGGGTLGGTFPVTLAGALAVCLAENLMTGIINWILFSKTEHTYIGSISSLDMKSASFQYGRPEKSVAIIAEAQIAKRLGFDYRGHSGLTDAKIPGFEAGVQKMMTAMFNASVCGTGNIVAGLLGADEIFSPVQMILENELIGALNHISRGIEVNEETLAYDAIQQVGPGGNFLASEHTAMHFINNLWQSHIWSDQKFNGWKNAGAKNDTDLAKEMYMDILNDGEGPEIFLDEETENKLMEVIGQIK
jgi:trimethylamine--corrinoid protein Co-methyltransferase